MKMFSAGAGIGVGIKDFRGIFIFDNKPAFERFLNRGWAASAQADAAVELGEIGGSRERAGTIAPGVSLYQLTENGLAAQITIQGTKYWKDDDLN
jgi:lipid-binding SYLF domain-containing protein